MLLQYFSISDTPEGLKTKYRQLALKHHPDKNPDRIEEATETMQVINAEFKHCVKHCTGLSKGKETITVDDMIAEIFRNENLSPLARVIIAAGALILQGIIIEKVSKK